MISASGFKAVRKRKRMGNRNSMAPSATIPSTSPRRSLAQYCVVRSVFLTSITFITRPKGDHLQPLLPLPQQTHLRQGKAGDEREQQPAHRGGVAHPVVVEGGLVD